MIDDCTKLAAPLYFQELDEVLAFTADCFLGKPAKESLEKRVRRLEQVAKFNGNGGFDRCINREHVFFKPRRRRKRQLVF